MNIIEFVLSDEGYDRINIFINGRNLIEMVREVELPFAKAERASSIAGAYMGMHKTVALLPSRHLLGEPKDEFGDSIGSNNRTPLLVCGDCGFACCWPLEAKVTVTESEVIWSEFCQPHRTKRSKGGEWRYDSFGPFRFDKEQYETALLGKLNPN